MDELLKILQDVKPDVDFASEKGLVDNAVLDSFDIVQIIQQLKDTFDIEITPADIVPENFNSAESLWAMVERLQ